ncbi:hypothetical protein [Brunnivagina elsteri]|nr:hypothetical protein [Calothrix elsteri]
MGYGTIAIALYFSVLSKFSLSLQSIYRECGEKLYINLPMRSQ